jgi:acetyl/propionyl-CoA carboxylase alpha subunit
VRYYVEVNGEPIEVDVEADGIRVDGALVHAHLAEVEGTPVHLLTTGSAMYRMAVRAGETRGRYTLWSDRYRFEVEALDERTRAIRALSGAGKDEGGPASLVAPMPGLIVRVAVGVGDVVEAGQGLIVMEAMKMENELRAASAGTVTSVRVVAGAAVEKGAVLVEMS